MPDEKITVEWIATAKQMLETIQKVDKGLERQEKALQKLTDTGKKGAAEVAGSFNRLEHELKENEAALKKLVIGSKEFDEQRRKVDRLRGSLARAKGELTGLRTGAATFGELKTAMLGGVAAAGSFVLALKKVADAQRDIVSTGADAAVNIDTMSRQMQIQASLTDDERGEQSRSILAQSTEAGATADTGFRTATQLVSSGFKDPVNTGTLTTALESMQATSFKGSPEEFIQGMSQVLAAYKLDKTSDNLQSVSVAMQGLFKQTDFQLTEGTDFAKNASVFEAAGLSMAQSMAGFAALREVLPAEQAGTGLRNMTTILQGAAAKNEQSDALKSIGIKPEEVDFIGENLVEVMQRLKKGLDSVDAETQQLAMIKLFGRENIAAATLMVGQTDRVQELETLQNDNAQFEADVKTAQGGMQAQRNRGANQELIDLMPNADRLVELDEEMRGRDRLQKAREQDAAAEGGGGAAFAVRAVGGTVNTLKDATGQESALGAIGGSASPLAYGLTIAPQLFKWFTSSDAKQDELIALQREANAIAAGNRPAARQPAQAPRNVGPAERVLPGGIPP